MTSHVIFPHIGDIHLGANVEREADRIVAVQQIVHEISLMEEDLGAILIPGDIFDKSSTVKTRNALVDIIGELGDMAPVIICYGNHEAPGDLDIFGELNTNYSVYIHDKPGVFRIGIPGGPMLSYFVLPYPTTAGLVAAGLSQAEIPTAARVALEAIFIDAGHKLKEARDNGDLILMLGHVDYAGSMKSIGQPSVGAEIEIDNALMAHLPQCYRALNHIHMAQVVGSADYAGSICRLDWGEIEPKTYSVARYEFEHVGLDKTSWYYYESTKHQVNVAPMYHVEGEFSRNGYSWHVTKGPDGETIDMGPIVDWTGCEVRARMRYRQSEGIVLAEAQRDIKAIFSKALRFEFEPVCVPDRAVRAPEVAAAKTFAEKLIAWAKVTGVILPASIAEKAAWLETQDEETLVAAETLRLEELATSPAKAPGANGEGPVVPAVVTTPHTPIVTNPEAREKSGDAPGETAAAVSESTPDSPAVPRPAETVASGLVRVTSSNLAAWGWANDILTVEFHDGVRWAYRRVPEDKWKEGQAAESIGKWFAAEIRKWPKKYPAEKVYDPKEAPLFSGR